MKIERIGRAGILNQANRLAVRFVFLFRAITTTRRAHGADIAAAGAAADGLSAWGRLAANIKRVHEHGGVIEGKN